jgi:hypothetical protein
MVAVITVPTAGIDCSFFAAEQSLLEQPERTPLVAKYKSHSSSHNLPATWTGLPKRATSLRPSASVVGPPLQGGTICTASPEKPFILAGLGIQPHSGTLATPFVTGKTQTGELYSLHTVTCLEGKA